MGSAEQPLQASSFLPSPRWGARFICLPSDFSQTADNVGKSNECQCAPQSGLFSPASGIINSSTCFPGRENTSSPRSSRDRGPLRVYEATQSWHDGAERQLTAEPPPQRLARERKLLFILQFVRWSITLLWINLIIFSVEESNPDWETSVSIWS